jgi:hypothetical protein
MDINVLPLWPIFSVFLYMGIGSWALCKLYGIKLRCYWGTTWEHDGNKGKKKQKNLPFPLKEKKTGPLMRAFWAFSLAAWTFMSETGDNSPPPPTPKEKKTGPLVRAHWAFSLAAWTFISKTVCHHFWQYVMAGAQLWDIIRNLLKHPSWEHCTKCFGWRTINLFWFATTKMALGQEFCRWCFY